MTDSVSHGWIVRNYDSRFRRQYASIMPQVVAVWSQQLGHEVHYATYYGQSPPDDLLPKELDVVFLSTYTQASALAYSLARLHRGRGALTVLGGPHATSFPTDSLRFFDLVVHDCDKALIAGILRGDFEPGSIVSSGRVLDDIPSVEERMPHIRKASFVRGKPVKLSNVPMLSSLGCPYRCDFCVDWKNDYVMMPSERLLADLRYVSERLPGVIVAFHDPNFGVKFDEMLDLMEQIPRERRSPYLMESSLSILRGPRLHRLKETNCLYVAPGVESWTDYSNKAGVGRSVGQEKLENVIGQFEELHRHVPALQANFLFGTDGDQGEEPVEMTREFIRRLPFVWPTLNIPVPFGGTPMYDRLLAEDRILQDIPFAFYYMPHLIIRPQHYDPLSYYDLLIRLYRTVVSKKLLLRRLRSARTRGLKALHVLRTMRMRSELGRLQSIRDRIASDPEMLAFLEGRSRRLPAFYREGLKTRLGAYAELLSEEDTKPVLETAPAAAAKPAKVVTLGGRNPRALAS
ncbi:MAG TPA: radical SAM protein [Thermoanaerobaculia bacterium]|nr:radical SAM protein [Thermoanaerobaculia bacterium]